MEQTSFESGAASLGDAIPPDLTEMFQQNGRRIVGHGSFGTVYRCTDIEGKEVGMFTPTFGSRRTNPFGLQVAVKAITRLPEGERAEFVRKMRRELGIWRRIDHLNILPLLGTASGDVFASDHICMVSEWMPNESLAEYVGRGETLPSLATRIKLIQGTAAGLEYLHSRQPTIVHGDFHPGNILIDKDLNPRITDFGYSRTLTREHQMTYLWTGSNRAGAAPFAAPELLLPELFPDLTPEVTLSSDICSLGYIIYFILSGRRPWENKAEYEKQLEDNFKSPLRPVWPVIPDAVWDFIEQCWSLQDPRQRPSAVEVVTFCTDRLEQQLRPNPTSDINVVLLGALGSGKSSIINLLANEQIAPVSTNMDPCTKRPRCYRIPIGERQFRLWDTTGFRIPRGGAISPLAPYEQAHAVLRDLPDGVHLILLCACKDEISPSLGNMYRMINDFFFGGHAPLGFVVTRFDTPEKHEEWWKRNERTIFKRTRIPVQEFIPRACTTTAETYHDQSRQALMSLLEKYAAEATPIPLHLDLSQDVATHCELSKPDAATLVGKLSGQRNPRNVVLFGETGAGKSSVINLIAGRPPAKVSSNIEPCTLESASYTIDTPANQLLLWDTMGFSGVRNGQDVTRQAVVNAVQLIRRLLVESSVDLIVMVKNCRQLSAPELKHYRLIEEFLCEGQVPVAVIITHLEDNEVMEQWWEMHGEGLLNALRGNIIGHACITSLVSQDLEDAKLNERLTQSKIAVQTLFDGCFNCPMGTFVQLRAEGGTEGRVPEAVTVDNLERHCGLSKELAKEVVRLYNYDGYR